MNGKTLAARIALVAVLLASATPAMAGTASQPYVPFVTDFPKPVPSTAASQPYVPFVTDFPKPAAGPAGASHLLPPVPEASSNGAWDEIGMGAGVGAVLVALLVGSSLFVTRVSRKEQLR